MRVGRWILLRVRIRVEIRFIYAKTRYILHMPHFQLTHYYLQKLATLVLASTASAASVTPGVPLNTAP